MYKALSFLRQLFPEASRERIAIVGGTVRDLLLGRESNDMDLVAALTEGELAGLGFRRVDPKSAAQIFFRHHPLFGKIEVIRLATMDDLENDLMRRDFTINAMAMDIMGGLIDPLGGRGDMTARLLRPCTDRSFLDDPLRIFRAFRFCSSGWEMAPEMEPLIRQVEWPLLLESIPVERCTQEMLKGLASQNPEIFFQLMLKYNIGRGFLPELFRMPEIPAGPAEHHPEGDLFTHSIQVLQRVASESVEPEARFCAMFHDIGKLATGPVLYPKHHGHDDAGFPIAVQFCKRLKLPLTYGKALSWVSRLHGKANRWEELRVATKVKMAEQAIKAGIAGILPLVSSADKPGNLPMEGWNAAIGVAGMNTAQLGLSQGQLEGMPAEKRGALVRQRRVEMLRLIMGNNQ